MAENKEHRIDGKYVASVEASKPPKTDVAPDQSSTELVRIAHKMVDGAKRALVAEPTQSM